VPVDPLLCGYNAGCNSQADAINQEGEIVGYSEVAPAINMKVQNAVIWRNGRIQNLNSLIPAATGWQLNEAKSINNRGQIVGTGSHNGQYAAFLLTQDDQR
jgi:probable HAF family extracellular repeat protein